MSASWGLGLPFSRARSRARARSALRDCGLSDALASASTPASAGLERSTQRPTSTSSPHASAPTPTSAASISICGAQRRRSHRGRAHGTRTKRSRIAASIARGPGKKRVGSAARRGPSAHGPPWLMAAARRATDEQPLDGGHFLSLGCTSAPIFRRVAGDRRVELASLSRRWPSICSRGTRPKGPARREKLAGCPRVSCGGWSRSITSSSGGCCRA